MKIAKCDSRQKNIGHPSDQLCCINANYLIKISTRHLATEQRKSQFGSPVAHFALSFQVTKVAFDDFIAIFCSHQARYLPNFYWKMVFNIKLHNALQRWNVFPSILSFDYYCNTNQLTGLDTLRLCRANIHDVPSLWLWKQCLWVQWMCGIFH